MKLLLMNNPLLREVCAPVEPEELDLIKSLVPDMTKILNQEDGAALAANQVGVTKRFFLMRSGELIINPEVVETKDVKPFDEGCLSIPGTSAETQRAHYVKLKFRDENFNEVEREFHNVDAVAILHEIDHLDGKLYIDQLQPMKRILTVDKHRKFIKLRGRR